MPPPPPGTYPPPIPPSRYEPPAPYPSSLPPPPNQSWQQDSNGYGNNRHRDRRDRRNDRDKGGKNKHNRRDNDRGRGQRQDQGKRPIVETRQLTPKPDLPAKAESVSSKLSTPKVDLGTPKVEQPTENKENEKADKEEEIDEEFAWDLEKAFIETEHKPGDPVGKPLAAEWNDDPTIPPAYNAKCIKTAFYDPDNPDAFLASVRDTKYWPDLQRDPVFRYRRGMVVVQFPGSHHEYFTYHCSRKASFKDRDIIPTPSDASLNDALIKTRIVNRPPSPLKRSFRDDEYNNNHNRDAKRARRSPNGRERSPPPRRRDYEGDPPSWGPHPSEVRGVDSPHSHRPASAAGERDRLAPHSMSRRNDSGYHSAYREEKIGGQQQQRHLLPSPSIHQEREYSRGRSPSYSRNGGRSRSRTRSPPLRSRSRSRSRSPVADSDSESGMSDLDYALLGMTSRKKKSPVKAMAKKPRVKVNDAFR